MPYKVETPVDQVAIDPYGPQSPEFIASTQQWLDDAVSKAQSAQPAPLRMEVAIGALDARLRLAPCSHVEPYIPVGSRLWGRTRLGLRCTQGGGEQRE